MIIAGTLPFANQNQTRSDIYNIETNTWEVTGNTNLGRAGAQLISIGSRVFAMGGWGIPATLTTKTVEEYHYNNRSWTLLSNSMIQARRYVGALTVPALLFRDIAGGCVGTI